MSPHDYVGDALGEALGPSAPKTNGNPIGAREHPLSEANGHHHPVQQAANDKRVELVPAQSIEQRAIDWLWKPRLARGKIALIAGDPGIGKSSLIADIVARCIAQREHGPMAALRPLVTASSFQRKTPPTTPFVRV
jgi:AAA domain-containing protein